MRYSRMTQLAKISCQGCPGLADSPCEEIESAVVPATASHILPKNPAEALLFQS